MTKKELDGKLDPCGCKKDDAEVHRIHGEWYVRCWACCKESPCKPYAYQAVNEWNEARRGEKDNG